MAKHKTNTTVVGFKRILILLLTLTALALLLTSCDSMSMASATTAAHYHEWTPWKTTKKASCTQEGEETRDCICGEKESRSLSKTEHSYVASSNSLGKGYTTYLCQCGDYYTDHYDDGTHKDENHDQICDTCGYLGLAPGLYDVQGRLLASWSTLVSVHGMKVDADYTWSSSQAKQTQPSYLLANVKELASGERLVLADIAHIGNEAFEDCNSLSSIIIPDSVTSIGNEAFYHCVSLTSIVIPDSVTSIGSAAFYDCEALTSVTIGEGLTSIGGSAFGYCKKLTNITIPDSVTTIDFQAFLNCTNLRSVTVGNGVATIEKNAFADCTSLKSITLPNSITSIASKAFGGCTKLENIAYKGTVDEWNAVSKESDWNFQVPAKRVVCSDGTINLASK